MPLRRRDVDPVRPIRAVADDAEPSLPQQVDHILPKHTARAIHHGGPEDDGGEPMVVMGLADHRVDREAVLREGQLWVLG